MLNGKLVSNNSDTLVIVFQSAGRLPEPILDQILAGEIEKDKVREYHQKYNWWKLTQKTNKDYFFIEDYYSNSYGWYMVDSGKSIIEELNKQLESFIANHGYKHVITFGSSKGGTAALLYGLINPRINNVFSLVPQIDVIKYINKHFKRYKELFFPNNNPELEQYFANIFFDNSLYEQDTYQNTNIYVYTGLADEQFNETLKLNQFLDQKVRNNNLLLNVSNKRHTPLVMDYQDFIFKMLEAISQRKKVEEKNLVRIRKGLFLLKG